MENPRPAKVAVVDEVRERLSSADAALLTEYRGLNVGDISRLRQSVIAAGGSYKIYKNTLVRLAVREIGLEDLVPLQGADVGGHFAHRRSSHGSRRWSTDRSRVEPITAPREKEQVTSVGRFYVRAGSVNAVRRALGRAPGGVRVVGRFDRDTIECTHTMDEHSVSRHWPVVVSRLAKAGLSVVGRPAGQDESHEFNG